MVQCGRSGLRATRLSSSSLRYVAVSSHLPIRWVGGIIFKIFISAQDGQNLRSESVGFGDFEIAAIWIRKRGVDAHVLEDLGRDATLSARADVGHWKP